MKYQKSELQEEKEKKTLQSVIQLVYGDHVPVETACKQAGISSQTFRNLKERYLPTTFEEELKNNNFNPHNWNHGWLKGEKASIYIKNKEGIVTYEDVRDEIITEMKKHSPKYPVIKRERAQDGHLLVVDVADLHIGKYSSPEETGESYDQKEAERRAKEALEGILQKTNGFNIDRILFVIGNDILHIDSPFRKTTSGTPQDTDGMWHESFIRARKLYVFLLESLLPIADVHCMFNPSNHDFMSGFMLADSLASWFRNSKNITFNTDMNHRKYFTYGKSLIGTTHGDGAKEKDLIKLMAEESPHEWADTKYRYWYCHHIHHKKAIEDIGGTIEYLRSPSASDAWHHRNGYVASKAVDAFIHSKEHGQLARITHYIN